MATHSCMLAWKIPWRILAGYSLWGHKEWGTTERAHTKCPLLNEWIKNMWCIYI